MTSRYSARDRALLERHVSSVDGNVYTISNLPEEVIAVVFAYVSRSPRSFRDNLLQLIRAGNIDTESVASLQATAARDYESAEVRARRFHEKWVVNYGHASVAEHAVVHVGIEQISRLASAELELSNPFLSFTEYSQRYQKPKRGAYHVPDCLAGGNCEGLLEQYHQFQDSTYDTYLELYEGLCEYHEGRLQPEHDESTAACKLRVQRQAFEDARYALTAAVWTSLGMTGNARAIRDSLVQLYSDPYAETSALADAIKSEATKLLPTLIRYADESSYQVGTRTTLARWAADLRKRNGHEPAGDTTASLSGAARSGEGQALLKSLWSVARHSDTVGAVRLMRWPAMELDLERNLQGNAVELHSLSQPPHAPVFATASEHQLHLELAARLLVEQGTRYREALAMLAQEPPVELSRAVALALEGLDSHDPVLDVSKSARYAAEFCISEASWHQLLRHSRRIDFTYGPPSAENGYTVPPHVEAAGLAPKLRQTVEAATALYQRLQRQCPAAAPYVVTNAHRRQVTASLSLWELYHLANLRLRPDSQWDIRYSVEDLFLQVAELHPLLLAAAERRRKRKPGSG